MQDQTNVQNKAVEPPGAAAAAQAEKPKAKKEQAAPAEQKAPAYLWIYVKTKSGEPFQLTGEIMLPADGVVRLPAGEKRRLDSWTAKYDYVVLPEDKAKKLL